FRGGQGEQAQRRQSVAILDEFVARRDCLKQRPCCDASSLLHPYPCQQHDPDGLVRGVLTAAEDEGFQLSATTLHPPDDGELPEQEASRPASSDAVCAAQSCVDDGFGSVQLPVDDGAQASKPPCHLFVFQPRDRRQQCSTGVQDAVEFCYCPALRELRQEEEVCAGDELAFTTVLRNTQRLPAVLQAPVDRRVERGRDAVGQQSPRDRRIVPRFLRLRVGGLCRHPSGYKVDAIQRTRTERLKSGSLCVLM